MIIVTGGKAKDNENSDAYSSPTNISAYKSLKPKIPFLGRDIFLYWI